MYDTLVEEEEDIDEIGQLLVNIKDVYSLFFTCAETLEYDFTDTSEDAFAYLNYLHGMILVNFQKYRLGIKILEESLSSSVTDYRDAVYEQIGMAWQELEKYDKALNAYNSCIDLNWNRVGAWSGKAACLGELKQYENALEAAETAFELAENDSSEYLTADVVIDTSLYELGEYERLLKRESSWFSLLDTDISESDVPQEDIQEIKKIISWLYYIRYLALKLTNASTMKSQEMYRKAIACYPEIESSDEVRELLTTIRDTNKDASIDYDTSNISLKNTISRKKRTDEDDVLNAMLTKLNGNEDERFLDDVLNELNALIGLTTVKEEIRSLINVVKIQKKKQEAGLKQIEMSLHMVFSGNPGTGKTTVARLVAEIYHKLGLISIGQLIEVDRSKLVAGYVGQTAIQTQEIIDSALGGVLFIDEAYTLSKDAGNQSDFGQEAIDTLLKAMEDNRNNLIVIVAGYPDLMQKFLKSNPGLESRFNTFIHFENYSESELMELFCFNCRKSGLSLFDGARKYVQAFFAKRCENLGLNFSNGRYVRNIFEKACKNQNNRLAKILDPSNEELLELIAEDFNGIRL